MPASSVDADSPQEVNAPVSETLLAEILRDAHHYTAGVEQNLQSEPPRRRQPGRGWRAARERLRNAVEQVAGEAGLSRAHYDSAEAAARLAELLDLGSELETTYRALADARSRRLLVQMLKLRVLGPYHVNWPIRPETFRAEQRLVDRQLRERADTVEVADPFFSPLSLYRIPSTGGDPIRLHCHSVDVVSVFRFGQYAYAHGDCRIEVGPGDTVIDAGACWGDTALRFADQVGNSGRVYAFECDPDNLELLHRNLALNPRLADRIEVVDRALWSSSDEELALVPAGRMSSLQEGEEGGRVRAVTVTLDDFVDATGLAAVDFLKMDVEGAELEILEGAARSLRRFGPRLAIAAYHRYDDVVRLQARTSALGRGDHFFLDTFSAGVDETVLFASPAQSAA